MNVRGRRFEVNKANGKIAGVCAGIGDHAGVDPTIVRIGFVLAAVLGSLWLALVAYGVLAFVGQKQGFSRRAQARVAPRAALRHPSREETRERMRDIDRRMQEVETYVASADSKNNKLAREIEELR
jgi:phage shock protein C